MLPISDPDTFWHIVAGRKLADTWQFAGPDELATFTQLPFVYHQWLPELAMYGVEALAGLPGVAWLFQLTLLVLLAAIYGTCRARAGVLAALLATVGTWVGVGGSLSPRPQVMGFILLVVSLGVWLRTTDDGRVRWWLLPLTWLWACTHGTWLYGPVLAVLFGVGLTLDRRIGRGQVWRIFGLGALMLGAAALTPVGPRLLLTPLAISKVSPFIMEWAPAPISEPPTAATLVMSLVVLVIWMRASSRVSWTRLLLWTASMAFTLLYARTIAIGAILMAPLLAEALQTWIPHRNTPRRWEVGALAGASLLSLLLAALLVSSTAATPGKVPARFNAFLKSLPHGTVVWNIDALGGWLMYEHPNIRPTMDTRGEVYGPEYVRSYVRAIGGYPEWPDTLAKTAARYAILSEDGPLAADLERQEGWTVVARDQGYALMMSPSP